MSLNPPLTLERLLLHIRAAAEHQRRTGQPPVAFRNHLSRTLRDYEPDCPPEVRVTREALDGMYPHWDRTEEPRP